MTELTRKRTESLKKLVSHTSNMLNYVKQYGGDSVEPILEEYQYSVDYLLDFLLDSVRGDQFNSAEKHIRLAFQMVAEKALGAIYRNFESNYSKLRILNRLMRGKKNALRKLDSAIKIAKIQDKIAKAYLIGDFEKYMENIESIQLEFSDLQRLLNTALDETSDCLKIRGIFGFNSLYIAIVIGVGVLLHFLLKFLLGW